MTTELAKIYTPKPAVMPIGDVWTIAEHVARSGLFPGAKTPDQAFTLMLICQADGLHPIEAVRRYHVIDGKPSMRSDAIQATFQARGGKITWLRTDTEVCEAEFSHPVMHPKPLLIRLDIARFRKSGLASKKVWADWPDAMLRARAIAMGVRAVDPGAVVGIGSEEEVSEITQEERESPAIARKTEDARVAKIIADEEGPVFGWVCDWLPDTRDYKTVAKTAVDTLNESAKRQWDIAGVPAADRRPVITLPDAHRHLAHVAINKGLTKAGPFKSVADAVAELSRIYPANKALIRREINAFLEELAAASGEVIDVEFTEVPTVASEEESQDAEVEYPAETREPGEEG